MLTPKPTRGTWRKQGRPIGLTKIRPRPARNTVGVPGDQASSIDRVRLPGVMMARIELALNRIKERITTAT